MSRFSHTATMTILGGVICIVIGYASWLSLQNIGGIYLAATEHTINEIKKSFLQASVANVIREIDLMRELEADRYEQSVDDLHEVLSCEADLTDEEFSGRFVARFDRAAAGQIDLQMTALLWNHTTSEVLYDSSHLFQGDLSTTLASIADELHYSQTLSHGEVTALWGVGRVALEEGAKNKIKSHLGGLSLNDGSQIWIDEILDYDGGLGYATRFDHTDHYEQLTYSTVYEDYGWMITMGIHVDEMEKYIVQTHAESDRLAILLSLRLVLLLVLLVILALGLVLLVENFYFKQSTRRLEVAVSKDVLTGAGSRRAGHDHLAHLFAEFRSGLASPALMMFDVDQLKQINDSFGHQVGDEVLKGVVRAVYKHIRSSDQVIRWGGDEFVVIMQGIKEEDSQALAAKIVNAVSSLEFLVGEEVIKPSISLGESRFLPTDQNFTEALDRADRALYKAKETNKNRVSVRS